MQASVVKSHFKLFVAQKFVIDDAFGNDGIGGFWMGCPFHRYASAIGIDVFNKRVDGWLVFRQVPTIKRPFFLLWN